MADKKPAAREAAETCAHCHGTGRAYVWSKDCGGVRISCHCNPSSGGVHSSAIVPMIAILAYAGFMVYLFG